MPSMDLPAAALPRRGLLALLPASLLAGAAHGQAAPVGLSRAEIAAWHDRLYDSTNAFNAPGGGSSGLRGWAMMALAMFEASNALDGRYRPYAMPSGTIPAGIDPAVASPRVAVAKAAQTVLDGLFAPPPGQAPGPLAHLRRFSHASLFGAQTAGVAPDSAAFGQGAALGRVVGQRILAARADDGHPARDVVVPSEPRWDRYQYGLPYAPRGSEAAGYTAVRPFAIRAYGLEGGEVAHVVPPLDEAGAAFRVQWEELYRYGTSDPARSARTPETDAAAQFHDGNFGSQIGNMMDILVSAEIREGGTDLLRIIALTAMSAHDAHANHWFWKYHYRFGRPITQYRQVPADAPNGLGACRDEAWTPCLTTSPNPEYPSGHACRTGGLTASLGRAFGDGLRFRIASFSAPDAPPRTYGSLSALQEEVMISRTYGGVHWRHSGPAGRDMAERVTETVWREQLRPIA